MQKTLLFTIDFPPSFGGVANYYENICGHLPADKIFVLAPKISLVDHADYKIYRENLITSLPIWPKWIFSFWYLYKVIKKEQIKNVLVGQVLPLGTVTLILSKILKFDYFVFTHGMDILLAQKTKKRKFLLKKILSNAKGVITNSEFNKKELVSLEIEDNKINIVYPCINPEIKVNEKIKSEIINKYKLAGKKILLSVGRKVERKGFDMVIKVMDKIVKEEKNCVYIIAGGHGNYSRKLKQLIFDSSANKNIIFLEDISKEEKEALYNLCDIFIMPCRQIGEDVEGFGIVFLEANLFGKPTIAGNSGGAVEAVIDNKTGLVVNSESEKEIANAVLKLLKDTELAKKLGEQGKERVLKEFIWENQVKKLKDIL